MGCSAETYSVNRKEGSWQDLSLALIVSLLVGAFAITNQSLWIDEANSALKAMQPSLLTWWHTLLSEKGSDVQMPVYMFYLWAWEKIAGHSEVALRLANLPWLFLANFSLARAARRTNLSPVPLLVLTSISPFLWFYMNEARPYMMQFAASCAVICGLAEIFVSARSAPIYLSVGVLLLAGSSMLAAAWSGTALLAVLFLVWKGGYRLDKRLCTYFFATMVGLIALASFYLWTLTGGARASAIGRTELASIGFVFYELFGFLGLGPGRLELRANSITALREYVWSLLPLGIAIASVFGVGLRPLFAATHRRKLIAGFLYGIPASLCVLLAGLVTHFRLLGRHFTPVLPLILIVLAVGLTTLWKSRWRFVSILLLLLWGASAFSLRFATRHEKDDYRDAAAEARSALSKQKIVWWAADRAAAKYYLLPVDGSVSGFHLLASPTRQSVEELPPPDEIILSKPDLYDANHVLAEFVERNDSWSARTLPAFTVWRR